MPKSSNAEALEKLKNFLLRRQPVESTVGAKEYIAGPLDRLRFFNEDTGAVTLPNNEIFYRDAEQHARPDLRNHERIHAGQWTIGKDRISPKEILDVFDLSEFRYKNRSNIHPKLRHMEIPAYELSDYRDLSEVPQELKPTQQMRNDERVFQAMKYLELLRRRKANPRGISMIEASTDPRIMQRVMKLSGPGITPPRVPGLDD